MEIIHICPKCGAVFSRKDDVPKVCSGCKLETVSSGYTYDAWYSLSKEQRLQVSVDIRNRDRSMELVAENACEARNTIREKSLIVYSDAMRFMDDETVSEDNICQAIQNCADNYGADIVIYKEAITRGYFDNDPIPCLRICHPAHEDDYFNFCIMRKIQGKTCLLQIYTCGRSTQMSLEAFQNNTQVWDGSGVRGATLGVLRGGAVGVGFAVGSAAAGIVKSSGKLIAKGIAAMMRDDASLSKEKDWYDLMQAVFQQVFSG